MSNMQAPASSVLTFISPKRKRDESDDNAEYSPSPIRLKTSLPARPIETDFPEGGSPRTIVAGQLQALNLQRDGPIPKLDFRRGSAGSEVVVEEPSQQEDHGFKDLAISQPHSTTAVPEIQNSLQAAECPGVCSAAASENPQVLEIPETPNLKPAVPPTPLSTSPRPHARRKSPPPLHLSWPATNLTWQESEITGHDPKDPSDDGYGINGVGFRPTPAIAYARAQRRKQQVTEWKNREAREARQRRSERRRLLENFDGMKEASLAQPEQTRKVRFVEG